MEDISLLSSLSEDDIKSLKETFYQQARELMESLVQEILSLEDSRDRVQRLKVIKRIFHTLKGDSGSVGLKELAGLIHRAEDLVQLVDKKSMEIDSSLTDLLLKIADCISETIETNRTDSWGSPLVPAVLGMIDIFLKDEEVRQVTVSTLPVPSISEYERLLLSEYHRQGKSIYHLKLSFSRDCRIKSAGMMFPQHLHALGDIIKAFPPLDGRDMGSVDAVELIMASSLDMQEVKRRSNLPGIISDVMIEEFVEKGIMVAPVHAIETKKVTDIYHGGDTIRVESERVDQLMNLVGELVIGRSMLMQLFLELEERFPREEILGRFAYTNSFIDRSLSDLQKSVMKVRMIPIDKVFKRFPRVVRDLAKAGNKDVRLIIKGEDTEIDKGLVDVIGEPLIHIIRNAIDHGIETAEEREAAGKNRQGMVRLEAYHKGNDIIIEVDDDGRGIDPKELKAKALEKGFLSENELERMDDREAINLIFLPGFSTAKVVSEVSGRGVGMDVVKTVVEGLRGSVQVRSEKGMGTTLVLRLPLTLAIIRALLFNVGNRLFATPLGSVKEITRVFVRDVEIVGGKEVLRIRDKVVPLIRLEEIMDIEGNDAGRNRNKLFVIVVNTEEKDIGIVVRSLVGEEELVIKAINDKWINTNIIGGASILGDGKVVLILNPAALVKRLRK
ncbi:MAG: chemotaxis protein CheA [Deltaproteobacteria bacterium]